MDSKQNINWMEKLRFLQPERSEEYKRLEEKRVKLHHMWSTLFMLFLLLGFLFALVVWMLRVNNLWSIISLILCIQFGAFLILAIVVKIIDHHYEGQQRKAEGFSDKFIF